jgi:predicted secreted protein
MNYKILKYAFLQETSVKKLIYTLLPATLILAACSGAPTVVQTEALPGATHTPRPERPTPSAAELELSDPARTIEVTAGSDFTITVRTTLATDFHWEIAEALDASIVEYVWKDHIPDDPGNPNSSGRDVWRFKAVAPGTTTIVLGNYKGMEATTPQMSVFTVVVR